MLSKGSLQIISSSHFQETGKVNVRLSLSLLCNLAVKSNYLGERLNLRASEENIETKNIKVNKEFCIKNLGRF